MTMNIGMLWFDNSKVKFSEKVIQAKTYYSQKYGHTPNLCFVHPSMVGETTPMPEGIEIRTTRSVLPNHFWIGVNGNPD